MYIAKKLKEIVFANKMSQFGASVKKFVENKKGN